MHICSCKAVGSGRSPVQEGHCHARVPPLHGPASHRPERVSCTQNSHPCSSPCPRAEQAARKLPQLLCVSPRGSPPALQLCSPWQAPEIRLEDDHFMLSSRQHKAWLLPIPFFALNCSISMRLCTPSSCQKGQVLIIVRWFTQRFLVCFVFSRIQEDRGMERTLLLCLK